MIHYAVSSVQRPLLQEKVSQRSQKSYLSRSLQLKSLENLPSLKYYSWLLPCIQTMLENETLTRRHRRRWCPTFEVLHFSWLFFLSLSLASARTTRLGVESWKCCDVLVAHEEKRSTVCGWKKKKAKVSAQSEVARLRASVGWGGLGRGLEKGGREGEWSEAEGGGKDGSSRMRVIIMTDVVYSHFPLHHLFCGGGERSRSFRCLQTSATIRARPGSVYPALCFPPSSNLSFFPPSNFWSFSSSFCLPLLRVFRPSASPISVLSPFS